MSGAQAKAAIISGCIGVIAEVNKAALLNRGVYMYMACLRSLTPLFRPYIHPLFYPSIHSTINSSICLSIHPSVNSFPIHSSIHPSIQPSIHSLIHPSIRSSIHPISCFRWVMEWTDNLEDCISQIRYIWSGTISYTALLKPYSTFCILRRYIESTAFKIFLCSLNRYARHEMKTLSLGYLGNIVNLW